MDRGRGRGWGRGRRGGGYAGRHRGRGRGWANNLASRGNNRAWVRPKGGDSEGVENTAASTTVAQHVSASAATGPILKGPRRNQYMTGPILRGPSSQQQQQGRGGRHSRRGRLRGHFTMGGRGHDNRNRNTWKRTGSEDSTDKVLVPQKGPTESEANAEKGDAAVDLPVKSVALIGDQFDDAPVETDEHESNGVVVNDQFADAPEDAGESTEELAENGNQSPGEQGGTLQAKSITRETSTLSAVASSKSSSSVNGQQEKTPQGKMIHKGSNKLILSTKAHTQHENEKLPATRKRPVLPRKHGKTVKRIKIQALESAESVANNKHGDDDVKEDGDATIQKDGDETKSKAAAETLTDFAYREILSSNRGRGGRSRSSRGRGGRGHINMGLVRVNPDHKNTPICPTFLRGIRCENERCRKRHDIPIESARPVCSFFQRHGQCLKGSNCPFRHVKVNARAILCPSFNLLGYCDDKQCVMKHETVNKSIRNVRANGKGGNVIDNRKDTRR